MDSEKGQGMISLAATFCLILVHSIPVHSSSNSPTAYEVLQDNYNFPVGLLPKGVNGYRLNPSTGEFSAYFNNTCSFYLQGSYKLSYKPTIKGYISSGKISSLEGVSVEMFFVSKDIVEVVRKGNRIIFSIGAKSTGFPVDKFEESPQCGCGLKCRGGQVKKLRRNPFPSLY